MNETLDTVRIDAIQRNPLQPRTDFDQEKLEALAESLREHGLLQPITVRPVNGFFEIVAGERRFRAAQLAGWDTVPCLVRELDDAAAFELAVLENAVREDLNPIEEATALKRLVDSGYSMVQIGSLTGLGTSQISWRVALLLLRPDVQHLVARRQVKPGVAYYLSKLTLNAQAKALRLWQENGLGDDGVRGLCDRLWAEENQGDMMPEMKVSEEVRQAAVAYRRALDTAIKAMEKLDAIDRVTLAAALAPEMEVVKEQIHQLQCRLEKTRRDLVLHNGKQLAATSV